MKKSLLIFTALFLCAIISFDAPAQMQRICGTTDVHNRLLNDPVYQKSRSKIEQMTTNMIAQNPNFKATGGVITIPVVVHVLYANATQNISTAKIEAQIEQLNDDFSATNSDVGNVPAVFTPLVSNTNIQFCLATQDPNGNPTDGIRRISTTVGSFSTNDNIKFTASGGDDAWPRDQYLNLWVGNLSGGLLGYAQFPGGPAATDGVVVLYNSVGSITVPGTGAPFNLGRTATHEVGHWLNLFHINGDSNCGNDQVADTPTQDQLHFGCGTHPYHVNMCGGGSSPNGEMFMNYMDYVDDDCMIMFSAGQGARMNACLAGTRLSLQTSPGCTPVVLQNNDAGISSVVSPLGTVCSTTISPIVTLRNFGLITLTSVTINYQVDAGTVSNFTWNGSLATGLTTNVNLPNVTVTTGNHTFNVYTSSPNGVPDQNAANDGDNGNFNAIASGIALPVQEGFTAATYPPTGWSINNSDASYTWERSSTTGQASTASIFVNNYDYNAWTEYDEMVAPAADLSSVANPQLTFYVAYQLYTNPATSPNYSDTLEVVISTDCGATWTSIYKKFGIPLTTTTPTYSTNAFTPNANQWRLETVSLAPYQSSTNAMIKFRNINQYENFLWLDNINIINTVGVEEVKNDVSFSVFPNPSNGIITVQWTSVSKGDLKIYVADALGKMVYTDVVLNYDNRPVQLSLNGNPAGLYIVKVQSGDKFITEKITLKE